MNTQAPMRTTRSTQAGRSLIETMAVIAIMIIFAAIAVPSLWSTYRLTTLMSLANELAGAVQETRSVAVKQNSPAALQVLSPSGNMGYEFFLDVNANDTMSAGDNVRLVLPSTVNVVATGQPALLTDANIGATSTTTIYTAQVGSGIYFNARGIPCAMSGSVCDSNNPVTAYVYYLQDTAVSGNEGWIAVSVTPAGRTKVWKYGTGNWQ